MKVITIFSGKGGVGKTTMSILLASWLKYYKKERVVAYDFETPESRMMNKRTTDLSILNLKSPVLTKLTEGNSDYYPIGAIKGKPKGYSQEDLNVIVERMLKAKETGDGYIICDFPGRFEAREAVYALASRGVIDLIVFPLIPEEQSVASMLVINRILKQPGFYRDLPDGYEQDLYCFWNMVTRNDSRSKQDIIAKYETLFKTMNIPVSPTRIRFVDTVKRSTSAPVFVTTTVCYPRLNCLKAFPPEPGSDAPYIENLFQEIKDRLDARP